MDTAFSSADQNDGFKKSFEHSLGLGHFVDKTEWRTQLDCFKFGDTANAHLPNVDLFDSSTSTAMTDATDLSVGHDGFGFSAFLGHFLKLLEAMSTVVPNAVDQLATTDQIGAYVEALDKVAKT